MDVTPLEDGFPFGVEEDSLADSMGAKMPNRSLAILAGPVGAGKSLISQRLIYGMLENGAKIVVVTTELTTRGWIEQMHSLGYKVLEHINEGRLLVLSRFGTIAESVPEIGLDDVLSSEAMEEADLVFLDSASQLFPDEMGDEARFGLMDRLRRFTAGNRTLVMCIDEDELDPSTVRLLKSASEVLIDLSTAIIGGDLKRQIKVTRFLRAAGPLQATIGWRVEPGMGFIVDITAVS